ncbi:peptidase M61 domain-containing [Fusarium albosuccineum]|uniref:Peptidase M61 domain-containing n=1 Tax=Fusarium albosuccineum TaxID=1237068 RepID=A0A8H4PAL9_9HYPO|nr:peptidase M61 domain-containing [Fusarium albosuccineum]
MAFSQGVKVAAAAVLCTVISLLVLLKPTFHQPLVAGPYTISIEDSPSPKTPFHVTLTPQFDHENTTSVAVSLRFHPSLELAVSRNLLFGTSDIANTQALDIEPGSLHSFDAHGNLSLIPRKTLSSGMTIQIWSADRDTQGEVTVSYVARARYVDQKTQSGPALDFRLEHGGFTTSAFALLLAPADMNRQYNVSLSWDLSSALPGTKSVWTYGEGVIATRVLTGMEMLWTYLGAGPLQSFNDREKPFNLCWFGSAPFSPVELGRDLYRMFMAMSDFFDDDDDVYRVFIRHNPYPDPFPAKLMVLAHEMIHNWIIWDLDVDMTADNWYPEGWTEYYSLLFLFKLGIISSEEYIKQVNHRLAAYYTNPFRLEPLAQVANHTWEFSSAQRLPYRRGFVFALWLDWLIYSKTDGVNSLDDLVLQLVRRQKTGLKSDPEHFTSILAELLGSSKLAGELCRNVTMGSILIVPPVNALKEGRLKLPVTLCRQDQEPFDLGFNETSARSGGRVIKELDPASRAAASGLRNGDQMAPTFEIASAESNFDKVIETQFLRPGGHEWHKISFRPHGWDKWESWCFELDE